MSGDLHLFHPPVERQAFRRRPGTLAHTGVLPMALAACVAVGLGLALGLLLTAAAIRSDSVGTSRIGPWRVFADVGTPGANPYQRARMARTGEIPLASAQGLTIVARHDSAGEDLDGRCTYLVSDPVPPARFWTIEAASVNGYPFSNPAGRQAFTATDLLRDVSGHFTIAVAPSVQPGNWLPLPGAGHFALVLRLYDTGLLAMGAAEIGDRGLPVITRGACAR